VRCPTIIIHGQKDTLIPDTHAMELHDKCGGPSKLIMPENMTHNDYDIHSDLVKPIASFLRESYVVPSIAQSKVVQQVHWTLKIPPACIVSLASVKDVN